MLLMKGKLLQYMQWYLVSPARIYNVHTIRRIIHIVYVSCMHGGAVHCPLVLPVRGHSDLKSHGMLKGALLQPHQLQTAASHT